MIKRAWSSSCGGDRNPAPVEMRFIDMFMAALGALVFMAMLMAFLLRYFPQADAPVVRVTGSDFQPAKFEITTLSIPAARVGESYDIALAFQGGLPPAIWEIVAGELPDGLRFDPIKGYIAGTPVATAPAATFVIRARDQAGASESRPFELQVLPEVRGSKKVETVLSVLMFIAALLLWLIGAAAPATIRKRLKALDEAHERGEDEITIRTGRGTEERIEYYGGRETLEGQLRTAIQVRRFFGIILLVLFAWLVWRLWVAD